MFKISKKKKRVLVIVCHNFRTRLKDKTICATMDYALKGRKYDLREELKTTYKDDNDLWGMIATWYYLEYCADDATHKRVKSLINSWIWSLGTQAVNNTDVIDFE